MKNWEYLKYVIYLFSPEDTCEDGCQKKIDTNCFLEQAKTVFWVFVSISMSMLISMTMQISVVS